MCSVVWFTRNAHTLEAIEEALGGELARLFKRLREVQGKEAALEVVGALKRFLKGKNAESLKSLEEAGEDLIALQSLNVPNTLHRSLLSTNAIENSFRNTRNKLGRVTRFRPETDQANHKILPDLVFLQSRALLKKNKVRQFESFKQNRYDTFPQRDHRQF